MSRTKPSSAAHAPTDFDLDAAIATEAKGEPFHFRLGGDTFTLPSSSEVDWHHAHALEDGDLRGALQGMLGEKQWAKFDTKPLPLAAVGKLMRAWMKHNGLKPGESQASTSLQ